MQPNRLYGCHLKALRLPQKLTGEMAKDICITPLYQFPNRNNKNEKEKARLTSMIKSGKGIKSIFLFLQKGFKKIHSGSQKYGVLYTVHCEINPTKILTLKLILLHEREMRQKIQRICRTLESATADKAES